MGEERGASQGQQRPCQGALAHRMRGWLGGILCACMHACMLGSLAARGAPPVNGCLAVGAPQSISVLPCCAYVVPAVLQVVTGKTFESEVLKSGKDVFIEFYAPWWWVPAPHLPACLPACLPWCCLHRCCIRTAEMLWPDAAGPALPSPAPPSPIRVCSGHCKSLAPIWEEVGKELKVSQCWHPGRWG